MHNIIEPLWPLAVPIDSVRLDSRNARGHTIRNLEAIKKSLETYGQRKPIVVNDGVIEAGNGLWQAAKALEWGEIAVVTVQDDKETAVGFAIMDNQSALLAEWDLPTLKDTIEMLDANNYDLELTGFDMAEIESMMTAFPPDKKDKGKTKCPECGYEW